MITHADRVDGITRSHTFEYQRFGRLDLIETDRQHLEDKYGQDRERIRK